MNNYTTWGAIILAAIIMLILFMKPECETQDVFVGFVDTFQHSSGGWSTPSSAVVTTHNNKTILITGSNHWQDGIMTGDFLVERTYTNHCFVQEPAPSYYILPNRE